MNTEALTFAAKREAAMRKASNYKGENIVVVTGRVRALRLFPKIGPCEKCGNPKSERHHKDGNTTNNKPDNIQALCRKHHMEADGRLEAFTKAAPLKSAKALKARWKQLGY